jgi:hypothetical protein
MTRLLKYTIFSFIVLSFVLSALLVGSEYIAMRTEKAIKSIIKEANSGGLCEVSLSIYYLSPRCFTFAPTSVDDLVLRGNGEKILVDGTRLVEQINLLKKIGDVVLIPVEQESFQYTRFYYVFENKKGQKLLDVSFGSIIDNMFINGIEFKEDRIFFDIVVPFLPKDTVEDFEVYFDW